MAPKYRLLRGLAHNLADSMFSSYGMFADVHNLPIPKLQVEILTGKTKPEITHETKSIEYYNKWFLKEIAKLGIQEKEIETVILQASWKNSKCHVTCEITLKNGKKYTA